jgi:molecular chaperone DnaK
VPAPAPPAPEPEARSQATASDEQAPTTGDIGGPAAIVGIDFGGRWMRVAVMRRGELELVQSGGSAHIPAMVALRSDGTIAVGSTARSLWLDDPTRAVAPRLLLRAMKGSGLDEDRKLPGVSIRDGKVMVQLSEQSFELKDLLIELLSSLKPAIVQHVGSDNFRVVISIPHDLDEAARALLKDACREAKLDLASLYTEPEAIVRAYALDEQSIETALIVDVGATHTGIALLKRGSEGLSVSGTRWIESLSAREIDATVVDLTLQEMNAQSNEDHRADPASRMKLLEAVERARIDIRRNATVELKVSLPAPGGASNVGVERTIKLPRNRIYQVTEEVVKQICLKIQELLRENGLHPRQLGAIVVAGSAGFFPPLVQALSSLTGGKDPLTAIQPQLVFVTGLAKSGRQLEGKESVTPPDRLAQSIGIELPGGRFRPLIRGGEQLPISLKRKHATTRDNQTEIELSFHQGEGELVRSCKPLGHLTLHGVPKGPRGTVQVDLMIDVDLDQIATITMLEPATQNRTRIQVATLRTPPEKRAQISSPTVVNDTGDLAQKNAPKKGLLSRLLGR